MSAGTSDVPSGLPFDFKPKEWPAEPLLDTEGLRSWHAFVDDFRRDVYPIVAEHGISLGEAIITFKLNELANILADIRDLLSEEETE